MAGRFTQFLRFFLPLAVGALALAASCSVPDAEVDPAAGGAAGAGPVVQLRPCEGDADCEQYPASKVCDTAAHTCVECLPGSEPDPCGPDAFCGSGNRCTIGCDTDADCGELSCVAHTCTGCASDDDCPIGTLCDTATALCENGCTETRGCPETGVFECCDTSCENTQMTAEHCGACGAACDVTGGPAACVNGSCEAAACNDGFADCDGDLSNGCEDLSLPDNCGTCGVVCTGTDRPDCIAGVCTETVCNDEWKNCTEDANGRCLINVLSDPLHCGACGNACSTENGAAECEGGSCTIICTDGFADCDGDATNGCEVELASSAANCGACGAACSNEHGTTTCSRGRCVPVCDEPFSDCDDVASNGCETNNDESVNDCGFCNNRCAPPNATGACQAGECVVAECAASFDDCDGDAANGCEAELAADVENCGACGTMCPDINGSPACTDASCSIRCAEGYKNCDGELGNGCEIFVGGNILNCGDCDRVCPAAGGEPNCVDGACGVTECADDRADCDNDDASNGCEVDKLNDPANCGGCGMACVVQNGTPRCNQGICGVSECDDGFADCDGSYANGCERSLRTVTDCGGCGVACDLPNAAETCSGEGACGVGSCEGSFRDCDLDDANGCEVDASSDPLNCNACGAVCDDTNGRAYCEDGVCQIQCNDGWGDCNDDRSDGCETNVNTSRLNCGVCGNACTAASGSAACVSGQCTVSNCVSPYDNCDASYLTGCETDTDSNTSHCGACGNQCSSANGTKSCADGACGIVCDTGFGNCAGGVLDGCETDTRTNLSHCGECDNACSFARASASCEGGTCELLACQSGFGNCDGNDTNGCETNTLTTPSHCGGCGQLCNLPFVDSEGCQGGSCTISQCSTGYANCNGTISDGCEANLGIDELNCGVCGIVCSVANGSAECVDGTCRIATCNTGWEDCAGGYADGCETRTASDVNNCGGCGDVCPSASCTPNCVNGTCGCSSCDEGLGDCDGVGDCEAVFATDEDNCGSCGTSCTVANATGVCNGGVCAIAACAPNFGDCNGIYADGCEKSLTTLTDCGGCGTSCSLANASESCATGSCRISQCSAGYANCDTNHANGCEANTNTSISTCGSCNTACSTNHGTASCTAGVCGIACATGYGNCNGSVTDGCETALTSLTNCGTCGTSCSLANATESCSTGACRISQCAAGYANCDGVQSNGCETNTNSSVTDCGACDNQCVAANGTAACSSGSCTFACNPGFADCDGEDGNGCEVSLATDAANCGSCDNVCTYPNAGAVCSTSTCGMGTCNTNYRDCNSSSGDGCERNVSSDINHCGGCNNPCTNPNGTTLCSSSACTPTCNPGYASCDANANNGCEVSIRTIERCGSCNTSCSFANATAQCTGTTPACSIASCDFGYANCDSQSGNGCERNVSGDVNNCGACGTVCNAANGTASCAASACSIACNTGYFNCDGDAQSNGCECGTACAGSECCVDMGAVNTTTTLAGNRCMVVRPTQGTVRIQVQQLPETITYTYSNACGASGSGAWTSAFSLQSFPSCSPLVIDLTASPASVSFKWWFEG